MGGKDCSCRCRKLGFTCIVFASATGLRFTVESSGNRGNNFKNLVHVIILFWECHVTLVNTAFSGLV